MTLLTAQMATALQEGNPRGLFVAIEHPSGTGYFCSGIGTRAWNGHTWSGTGKFGGITPIKHSSEVAVQDITFSLSGIDASLVAGLNDNVQNLNGSVWLFCLGPDESIVRDPYQLIDSVLDYQTFSIGNDGTATIAITAHSGFYTLARGIEEAWTSENQKRTFSTDAGLDMISGLQNQNLLWTPT